MEPFLTQYAMMADRAYQNWHAINIKQAMQVFGYTDGLAYEAWQVYLNKRAVVAEFFYHEKGLAIDQAIHKIAERNGVKTP